MLARGVLDHLLVRVLVIVPVLALAHVRGRKLPVFSGFIETGEETPLLFLAGKMQEELPDYDSVSSPSAFE